MKRKQCFKCKRRRALSRFYPHPMMADGYLGKCKDCTKRDVALNYEEHRTEKSAYDQQRNKKPKRKAAQARYQQNTRERNPEKYKARTAVGNAIRDRRLIRQPCQVQPCETKAQAHHSDYSKPLEVDWLCFKHHRELEHGQTVTIPF